MITPILALIAGAVGYFLGYFNGVYDEQKKSLDQIDKLINEILNQ
jgi:hypothetical protein